jgi:hypothetical protein
LVACGGVRVLEQTKTRKTKRMGHTRKTNGGCRSPHQKMSEVTPSYRDLPHRGSMNPGRAPRWSSAHCPRGVPAMKMTPLQASNLKQEDNLRPQKMYHTANDTAKRFGFFLPTITWLIRLSVVGPDESRATRPDRRGKRRHLAREHSNTAPKRWDFQRTWGKLGGAAHGLSRLLLVPIIQQGMPDGAFRYRPRKCRRYLSKTSSHWSYGSGWPERPQTYSKMSDGVSQPYHSFKYSVSLLVMKQLTSIGVFCLVIQLAEFFNLRRH